VNIELNQEEWEALEAIIHAELEEAESDLDKAADSHTKNAAYEWQVLVSGIQQAIDIENERAE
jgi:hypothetical protein